MQFDTCPNTARVAGRKAADRAKKWLRQRGYVGVLARVYCNGCRGIHFARPLPSGGLEPVPDLPDMTSLFAEEEDKGIREKIFGRRALTSALPTFMSVSVCPTGKRGYTSQAYAEAGLHLANDARRASREERRKESRVYECDLCGAWHLSSQPKHRYTEQNP